MIACPNCNRDSVDEDFCDHCNQEIVRETARHDSSPPTQVILRSGIILDCSELGGRWPNDDGRCFQVTHDGKLYRIHAFGASAWCKIQDAVEHRVTVQLDVLPRTEVVAQDGGVLVLAEATGQAPSLLTPPANSELKEIGLPLIERLVEVCRMLHTILAALHEQELVLQRLSAFPTSPS